LLFLGPIYVAPMGRTLYIVLLAMTLVVLIPGLVLFLILVVTRLKRRGKQVALDALERDQRLTVVCAAFVVPAIALELTTNITPLAPFYVSLVVAYVAWSVRRSARRMAYRSAIVVRRSPEETFEFVSNPHNWGRYYAGFEVEEPIEEPLKVGSTIRLKVHIDGHVISGVERITRLEPYHRFASHAVGHEEDGGFEFTPVAGGTEVAYSFQNVMTVSQALLGGSLRRGIALREMVKRREASMRLLKELLEAAPAATV
jgi:Polyketide cyclase / dehydrase and lipid transport